VKKKFEKAPHECGRLSSWATVKKQTVNINDLV
jgi:hypothetical protein